MEILFTSVKRLERKARSPKTKIPDHTNDCEVPLNRLGSRQGLTPETSLPFSKRNGKSNLRLVYVWFPSWIDAIIFPSPKKIESLSDSFNSHDRHCVAIFCTPTFLYGERSRNKAFIHLLCGQKLLHQL